MQARQARVKIKTILATTIVLGFFILGVGLGTTPFTPVLANTENSLRDQIAELESQINSSQDEAEHLHKQAETLQEAVDEIDEQIEEIEQQIKLTELKIAELTEQLEETRTELERQKIILGLSLREHYKIGEVTTVELFVSSDNFADFFNQKEYLERVRNSIKESSVKVAELEVQLEEQEAQQKDLLVQQSAQRKAQVAKRNEKEELLIQTKGEAARYEALVKRLGEERKKAEKELYDFLSQDTYVSLGFVEQGDRIGAVGSTGYSTGPHLHFALWNDNADHPVYENFEDPRQGSGLKIGMIWPIDAPFYVSTEFGMVHCSVYTGCNNGGDYSVAHRAIDLSASLGSPVIAAQSGNIIFRGWSGGLGYMVIIDHGNGYKTYYPHMCDGDICYGYN